MQLDHINEGKIAKAEIKSIWGKIWETWRDIKICREEEEEDPVVALWIHGT